MADDVTITVHVRDLTGPGFQSVNRNLNQLQRQANQMGGSLRIVGGQLGNVAGAAQNAGDSLGGGMGLRGQAIGAAAALGATLLPTIGALAPMLTGLAVVGGGAALAMDDLKKKAKELKKPFEEWQKVAEKAVAPHTEKAVTSLKGAMKDLTPVIEIGAETFGRITQKAAAFADSPAFKGALAKNAEMGARWVEEFAGSVGTFTQAFLDFGTKSQPALDAWDNLLGGMLDTGLPSMFKEMEQGIGGSSDFLNGLAYVINDSLLPSLGKVAGSFAEAFGPLLEEMLRTAGDLLNGFALVFEGLMEVVEPVALVIADGWRAVVDVLKIGSEVAGSFAKSVGGALLEAALAVAGVDTSKPMQGFTQMSDWVSRNEATIRAAFFGIAQGITDMVSVGVAMLPQLWAAFRLTTEAVLLAVDGMVSGLATAFGDLPIIGDTFKDMNSKFDGFAKDFRGNLDDIGGGINSFVEEALPRLNRAQLTMNVDQAKANLDSVKKKLEDPALTKERKAKLTADKEQAEATLAAARRRLREFDQAKAEASLQADPRDFFGDVGRVRATKLGKKTVPIGAGMGAFNSAVGGIIGKVLGTSYINVAYRQVESNLQPRFNKADGGVMRFYAGGGMENHVAQIAPAGSWRVWGEPETGGEAYIPLSPAKRIRSRAIAEETVDILGGDVQWFAKGKVTKKQKAAAAQKKAESEARRDAMGDLTISHFGQMAGYKTSEIIGQFARADSIGELVNALNQWRNIIKKATHGGVEKSLLKSLDSAGKKLLSWEKQLGKVEASLSKAKDKLNDLKSAASQLADSVKSGILSGANITRAAGAEDSRVTINTILSQMQGSAANAKEFDKALKELKKRGLSSSLLQQIAEAGIEGGGLETAQALLGASSGQLKSLNDLQSQIVKSATSAGKVTADAVYGAAIKAQTKLVNELKSQQKKLTDAMETLAKAMEKLIESAFKGKAAGGIVGAASGGIRSNLTWVGEQGPELLDLPAGSRVWSNPDSKRMQQAAWASMLNEPRGRAAAGQRAAGPAGGDRPIVLNVHLGDRELGQIWVDVGRKQVATRGGVKATLGRLE